MFSKTDFQGIYGKSSKIMSFLSLSFLALASRLEVKGLTQAPEEKERTTDTSKVERCLRHSSLTTFCMSRCQKRGQLQREVWCQCSTVRGRGRARTGWRRKRTPAIMMAIWNQEFLTLLVAAMVTTTIKNLLVSCRLTSVHKVFIAWWTLCCKFTSLTRYTKRWRRVSLLPEVDTDFGKRHFCGQVRVEFSLGSDIQVFKVFVSGEKTCRGQTPSKGNSLYSLF